MTRREGRELAFILLFEQSFSGQAIDEIIAAAGEARDVKVNSFARSLVDGANEYAQEASALIEEFSEKWSAQRISRVAMAIMRVAIFEMLHIEDMPESVSINEAVELAKTYGGEEDSSFVNGVLGGISRRNTAALSPVDAAPEKE